jgi:hypothetical protein
MYYVTIISKGANESIRTPFRSKKSAVEYFKGKAYEIINNIVSQSYRPDVMTIETVYDGERTKYEISIVALSDNLIGDKYSVLISTC